MIVAFPIPLIWADAARRTMFHRKPGVSPHIHRYLLQPIMYLVITSLDYTLREMSKLATTRLVTTATSPCQEDAQAYWQLHARPRCHLIRPPSPYDLLVALRPWAAATVIEHCPRLGGAQHRG